jgi:probable F420-dependent oxidoreductase
LKVDAEIAADSPSEAAGLARKAEDFGFDCLWVNETKHDPFVQLSLAAANTSRISLGTSIALAFTRSPTTLAHTAWDIQSLSGARLILGLRSQVKAHNERRFGMKSEPPSPKMNEVVVALRSVWASWQDGRALDFQGRFFSQSLMTPFFNPGPIEHPRIPVYVAGVNEGMCSVAGSIADGLHVHPLHTMKYLREVVGPALQRGEAKAGRRKEDVTVAASVFAVVGENESERKRVREAMREQISFYASTRSYRKVMEVHGWGDVCDRLHELSSKGEWGKMSSEVGDDMLEEFCVEGDWGGIGTLLKNRYSGVADRVRLYLPFEGEDHWTKFVRGFRA